jgi:hypothetical protein
VSPEPLAAGAVHDDRSTEENTMAAETTGPQMSTRLSWDEDAGAGYLPLAAVTAGRSARQQTVPNPVPGRGELVLDFDADGRLLGIEFLDGATLPPGLQP